ncbi:hypothetical protein L226DRAFT_535402 [Lentinus tigrinus ALCF2SS1-7]|uniref:Uncharacterized protein n=1 Tax=Lentinus tigrinus ALCF2SS1-6 TaxID=1328759 RepID=A0A5C2SFP4_9APHY|nr:hypothetical protein L227DRAFT_47312 [Lentinus tigrinus ALCF2SS1-6]RPD74519.1 hypothetical protein L226DRAFT_535402 [Lentinus tigrinus ALCF2SS1-7]
MVRLDPPYPSFTFVMMSSELRLPAYSHKHQRRHHPYVRVGRRRLEDAFMAIDAAASSPPPSPVQPQLRPTTTCTGRVDNDVSSFELDAPAVGAEPEEDTAPPAAADAGPQHQPLGRTKIVDALAELMGVVRRRLALWVLDAHNSALRK